MKALTLILAATTLSLAGSFSHATLLTTYTFEGVCADCGGQAIWAELVLNNYDESRPVKKNNFESFTYSGSNLVGSLVDGQAVADTEISVTAADVSGATNLVLTSLVVNDLSIESLNFRLINMAEPIWGCTEDGYDVASSGPACDRTSSLVFRVNSEGWHFGAPAKDHGSTGAPHTVPEPGSLGLFSLALFGISTRFKRQQS